MKLKLTHSEFTALLQMFIAIVMAQHPADMHEKMQHALMMQIYEKMYKQALFSKKQYAIKLTIPEAIAFYFFWQAHEFINPASFEANLVRTANNHIHQKLIV